VYRPQAVRPDLWHPMLTFARLAEGRDPGQGARRSGSGGHGAGVREPDPDARGAVPRRVSSPSTLRAAEFRWLDDIHKEEFRLAPTRGSTGRWYVQLIVFLGAFILAYVKLMIKIDSSVEPPPGLTTRALEGEQGTLHGVLTVFEPSYGSPIARSFRPTVTETRRSSGGPSGWGSQRRPHNQAQTARNLKRSLRNAAAGARLMQAEGLDCKSAAHLAISPCRCTLLTVSRWFVSNRPSRGSYEMSGWASGRH
jgi:hypothetical protein